MPERGRRNDAERLFWRGCQDDGIAAAGGECLLPSDRGLCDLHTLPWTTLTGVYVCDLRAGGGHHRLLPPPWRRGVGSTGLPGGEDRVPGSAGGARRLSWLPSVRRNLGSASQPGEVKRVVGRIKAEAHPLQTAAPADHHRP